MRKLLVICMILSLLVLLACTAQQPAGDPAQPPSAPAEDAAAESETPSDDENWDALVESFETGDVVAVEKAPREITLYLPNDNADGFETVQETVGPAPEDIVAALAAHGALPKGAAVNDFLLEDNGFETVEGDGPDAAVSYTVGDVRWITLDLSAEFRDALTATGTAGEAMLLGSLVNTMLEAYDAESLTLTCEGAPVETGHNVYDQPLTFFQMTEAQ